MKYFAKILFLLTALVLGSCADLDIDPTSSSASGNFYSNQKELEIAVNDLYQEFLFKLDLDEWGDDHWIRGQLTNPITNSTLNSQTDFIAQYWADLYKGISRATTLLENMQQAEDRVPEAVYNRIEAEARFVRAYCYSILISHFGDVVFYGETVALSESYDLPRTDKKTILDFIFKELDAAAQVLPQSYSASEIRRVTKSTALGIKARIALYMGDYATARDAAKAVIDLKIHSLFPNYRTLFTKEGENSSEIIFSLPQSISLGNVYEPTANVRNYISRNSGGFGAWIPTWSMLDIYECTDGQTIDKSPLYDPHQPFKNRDPRMAMSIVELGSSWLGFTYQPHPDSVKVYSSKLGTRVNNNDTRSIAQFASYTGFIWKKRIDQSWADLQMAENPIIVLRYADILLMYAEAKIELNEIDQSVLDALNTIRARAYGKTSPTEAGYPKITTTDQAALRNALRRERRVELVLEGLRYMDLIRWKLADKALNTDVPGLNDPTKQDRKQWPFTNTLLPRIDENGLVFHDHIIQAGFARKIAGYQFDASKQYLWPIPASERLLNPNLTQNPGY
ncbi:RagB/SusD family nutrient uptake outer membrane protein [Salmonirosea aquatica]|uniref:RagB/SusD family nutrient uptake outer membrane protein n=1 Tax=Salmonirosea aquatica TaxID=2654236 RepID=A0A7C9BB14_9BACT|nr:RagB/SusD family nutrient uptake outer membrane protein [Cytophagaceae bacterium SJW1-29]